MSDVSPRLALPLIAPAQAQKHVTHNEALVLLDILAQLSVKEVGATVPPDTPVPGDVWALGTAPTGEWAGQDDMLAAWVSGGWLFLQPSVGWQALDQSVGAVKIWDGSAWNPSAPDVLSNLIGIGVNTTADTNNRLAVSSPATLLNHDGGGHQLKLNKASDADTASLLFQTNWSGRAEMGTVGSDDFEIKVSADGAAWLTAMSFAGADGTVSGSAVQQDPQDVTTGRLARADFAFGPGNLVGTVSQTGGTPTGAVLEQGENANGGYLRLACGTQFAWHVLDITDVTEFGAGTFNNPYSSRAFDWVFPAGFDSVPTVSLQINTGSAAGAARRLVAIMGDVSNTVAGSITVSRFSGDGSALTPKVHAMAVGRWY